MTPFSEQLELAIPAMREWLRANTTTPAQIDSYSYRGVEWLIGVHYPGGIDQFIEDQEEERRG